MVAAAFHGHGKLVRTAERADEQGDQHRHQCLDAVHELAVIQHCAAGFLGVHDLFGLINQQRDKPQGDRHHHGKLMHRQVQLGKGFQQRFNGIRQHNGAGGVGQQAGYDYSFSDFLTIGDDSNALGELNPDTEYVLFAFGLDESGVATTDLRTDAFRTEPFVPTDDCTFTVGFERVAATRMNVTVAPSNPATRYYVGLCDASNLDRYTTDELAGQFIAQENRNGLDWGGNRYIFTGVRSLDTAADLDLEELAADTEYAAVVFGIGADGIRTTLVACARCRTERVPQSEMTVEITVTNITSLGAVVTFRPSVDDETYFTDCIDYETYAAYDGDDEAFVRSVVAQLGSGIDAYLTVGYHRLDAEGYLQPGTAYVAYAFGYSGGVTTPLMKSGRFVTEPLSTGSPAEVVITAEVRDGDDFYAADPVKYASYRGKAVIYAHLEPNAKLKRT